MFELVQNDFANLEKQSCKYRDEYGNTCFMKRGENCIIAKLRFSDTRISAEKLVIPFPPKEGDLGVSLFLQCDGREVDQTFLDNLKPETEAAIGYFTTIIQRWIQMMYDISFLSVDNNILLQANETASLEDVYHTKFEAIRVYEELQPVISSVMGDAKDILDGMKES